MAHIVTGGADLKYDRVGVIPLGGQSELGQTLWVLTFAGQILLIDAGAAYPAEDLPGVDLLFPNTNFLEANQEKILALVLTNAHEEHCGAVSYLLHHLRIPKIMGPRFVSAFLAQCEIVSNKVTGFACPIVDTVEMRHPYHIGPFEVEWIQVNDAIADACALRIGTPEGNIIYTSSYKLDQTPVDNKLLDVSRLAQVGDDGVLLLIGDSAGVESEGYTPSERAVVNPILKAVNKSSGRVIVVMLGTNTHRLQILFDIAHDTGRQVALVGETLMRTAVSAAITGNLHYNRKIEASLAALETLPPNQSLIIATGQDGDPMNVMIDLAEGRQKDLTLKEGDTVIYSADIYPGRSRQMAMILDQFMSMGITVVYGIRHGIHVSKHASREEQKLMLSIANPKFFVPALGEGRHIMHHAQLAMEWGLPADAVFPLKNGDVLELHNGVATVIGAIEAAPVYFNKDQGDRVTTYSVNERRSLSLEGIVTIGLVVDHKGILVSGPSVEVSASGFLKSPEWLQTREELLEAIKDSLHKYHTPAGNGAPVEYELGALRASVREVAVKALRTRLQAKPTVQVVVHELAAI